MDLSDTIIMSLRWSLYRKKIFATIYFYVLILNHIKKYKQNKKDI